MLGFMRFCENEFSNMTPGISLELSEFYMCVIFFFLDVTDIIACDQARIIISLKPCDVYVFFKNRIMCSLQTDSCLVT